MSYGECEADLRENVSEVGPRLLPLSGPARRFVESDHTLIPKDEQSRGWRAQTWMVRSVAGSAS